MYVVMGQFVSKVMSNSVYFLFIFFLFFFFLKEKYPLVRPIGLIKNSVDYD